MVKKVYLWEEESSWEGEKIKKVDDRRVMG